MKSIPPELEEQCVYYCRNCHSLKILVDDILADDLWDGCYCGKCGSTDIGICEFDKWLAEEERRKKKKEEIEWNK
jgi:hypothetical protein